MMASICIPRLLPLVLALSGPLLVTAQSSNASLVWPAGDPNRCLEMFAKTNQDVKRFGVFPGLGWDNLRNVEASQVVQFSFNQCKLTNDGRYLIPDNVFTVPLKISQVQSSVEFIDLSLSSSSVTASTINRHSGLYFCSASISGGYSYENQQLRSRQLAQNVFTARAKLQYDRYVAKLQVDPTLSPQFKSRLMSLAAHIEMNHTEMAYYESQLIVRDFGTHVLKSVTAGAALVKEDFIKKDSFNYDAQSKSKFQASYRSSYSSGWWWWRGYSSYSSSSSQSESKSQVDLDYKKNVQDSSMQAFGGPLLDAENMTLSEWVAQVDLNLVPMDRAGDPLYYVITPQTLPDVPEATAIEAAKYVRKAIEAYYDMNFIPGCADSNSTEFSRFANFDDGACTPASPLLRLGGVYQNCKVVGEYLNIDPCAGLCYKNPVTKTKSCPSGQKEIIVYTGSKLGPKESKRYDCYRCGYRGRSQCCRTKYYQATAQLTTIWCVDTNSVPDESKSYRFGGMYSLTTNNILTGAMTCPPEFQALTLLDDLFVCIIDPKNEKGKELAVPFGGFFSCKTGNPLAHNQTKCPEGFSQQLAIIHLGCPYYYCVESKMLSGSILPAVKRPPYMMEPAVPMEKKEEDEDEEEMVMFNMGSQTWIKDEEDIERSLSAQALAQSQDGLSAGAAAAIAVVCTLIVIAAALAGFVVYKRRQYNSRTRANDRRENSPTELRGTNQYGGV